jgi:hypothetical protein
MAPRPFPGIAVAARPHSSAPASAARETQTVAGRSVYGPAANDVTARLAEHARIAAHFERRKKLFACNGGEEYDPMQNDRSTGPAEGPPDYCPC